MARIPPTHWETAHMQETHAHQHEESAELAEWNLCCLPGPWDSDWDKGFNLDLNLRWREEKFARDEKEKITVEWSHSETSSSSETEMGIIMDVQWQWVSWLKNSRVFKKVTNPVAVTHPSRSEIFGHDCSVRCNG